MIVSSLQKIERQSKGMDIMIPSKMFRRSTWMVHYVKEFSCRNSARNQIYGFKSALGPTTPVLELYYFSQNYSNQASKRIIPCGLYQ